MIACLLAPAPAWASPLFELLGAQEGGFAGRATPSGANAAYFNPALLLDAEEGMSAEYFLLIERLEVTSGARESAAACRDGACDVPEVNGAGPDSFRHEDGSLLELPTLPTEWLERGRPAGDGDGYAFAPRPRQHASSGDEERGYVSLGLVQAPLRERLAYGLQLLLPLQAVLQTRAFYSDEREQFFSNSLHHELYGDRLDTVALAFGLGALVVDRLALGAGLTLSIAGVARAPTYVPSLADLDTLLIDSNATVATHLAPHFGASVTPIDALRFSATIHSPQGTELDTGFGYVIATGIEQHASQRFRHGYLPWTLGLGAELSLGSPQSAQWWIAAASTYAFWSSYRDRHDENPRGRYAWSNMLDIAVTTRVRIDQGSAFVSATYEPTPVPDQTGRSNYVDSDRVGLALGGSYRLTLLGVRGSLGLQAQLHRLLARSAHKELGDDPALVRDELPDDAVGGTPRGPIPGREGLQTNNPGFPSFANRGFVAGIGARVTLFID